MQKLLLVDDHEMIRDAIKQYLVGHSNYIIVDEALNGQEAFKKLLGNSFDLVITDVHMPLSGGLELIENIRLNFPEQKVLALTMDTDPKIIRKLDSLAINGYILKNAGQKEFLNALDLIFNNQVYYSPEIQQKLNEIKDRETSTNELSPIETKILALIVEQTSQEDIIRNLNLDPHALPLLIKSLHRKCDSKTEHGLVLYAIENGLV